MNRLFVKSMIPKANLLDVPLGKFIYCYEYNNSIYVLVDAAGVGQITVQLKVSIAQNLISFSKLILYVSLFERRLDFNNPEEIAWGSYVWFADAPKHYVHFEDKPSKINITAKNLTY